MSLEGPQEDRADPAIRAAGRLEGLRLGDRNRRMAGALVLGGLAVTAPAVAEPLTGNPGASVGAVLLSVLLVALAVVAWPSPWLPEEREHRELEAIWQEVRADPDAQVAWDRYAAWARSRDELVELLLSGALPRRNGLAARRARTAPASSGGWTRKDAAAAAAAMENLRAEASQQEIDAQQDYERRVTAASGRLAMRRYAKSIVRPLPRSRLASRSWSAKPPRSRPPSERRRRRRSRGRCGVREIRLTGAARPFTLMQHIDGLTPAVGRFPLGMSVDGVLPQWTVLDDDAAQEYTAGEDDASAAG